MDDHSGEPGGGGYARESGGKAAHLALGPVEFGIDPDGMPRTIGGRPRGEAPAGASRRAARSVAVPAPRSLHARPELNDDLVGAYMQDAIERGGYRAALEYYGSDEAKKSEAPWHRLRARGWLLGRLGLYDQVQGWLEEASAWPDFDHLPAAGVHGGHAAYRPSALWLKTPEPARRSAGGLLTIEPAAAANPDPCAVPGYIWVAMLILDATGPICSHAGLGAAAFLVGAGPDWRDLGATHGPPRYNPSLGARLYGAPEGCHRWIIADIDFDPRPVNKPHYYYDLTDEGRAALDMARGAGSPWTRATEAAASGLGGMTLPDLLENACRPGRAAQGLDKTRDELSNLLDAWTGRKKGPAARVCAEDQTLADLGPPTKWHATDDGAGSTFDHLLYLMTVVRSAHAVACEAEPTTRAEGAVLGVLIGAIQGLCRRHGRAVAAAAPPAGPPAVSAPCGPAGVAEGAPRRPPYTAAMPAMISDLYYCLAEYCRSRRLAADPCSLPLSKVLTGEERALVAEALEKDSPSHGDIQRPRQDG